MFFLLGIDGREYGPYTADQIRQWMAEGRANADTHLRRDGETTSQPIREMAEFAGIGDAAFAGPPRLSAQEIAATYLARHAVVDIGGAITRGWALVWANPGPCMGGAALVLAISLGLGMIPLAGIAVALVVTGPLHAGFEYVLIRRIRGEQVSAGDVFAGFSIAFLQLFLTHLISALLTTVGICLCLIPGIYLAVSYLFALPLAIDKRMEFWTAMEVSRQVVQRHWWSMFAYAIVTVLMLGAGTLMCLVGLIVALPVAVAGLMYIYEDLFGGVAA